MSVSLKQNVLNSGAKKKNNLPTYSYGNKNLYNTLDR